MGPMALTETALDTLLGALDDVGDPGIVHIERLAARGARTGEPFHPLPAEVRDALGVSDLWSHQVAALDLARAASRSMCTMPGSPTSSSAPSSVSRTVSVSAMGATSVVPTT